MNSKRSLVIVELMAGFDRSELVSIASVAVLSLGFARS